MYDLICFGSLVVDLYFKASSFDSKEGKFTFSTDQRKDVDYFLKAIGGGAVNVAIGTQKLGMKVGLASVMGDNTFSASVKRQLDEAGIDYSLSEFLSDYYNVSLVLMNDVGERSIINFRTPLQSKYENMRMTERLYDTKVLFLANLPNLPLPARASILQKAKQKGILTITNFGISDCYKPREELEGVVENTDILMLNSFEFAAMVKKEYEDLDFTKDLRKEYLPDLETLVITDAENGSYAYTKEQVYIKRISKKGKVVDTNGAGDAYTAGFIAQYVKTKDISSAMDSGTEYAAKIISKVGAN